MCILSVYRNKSSYILTHNRDEHKNRKSSDTIYEKEIHDLTISYPVDLQSGGTWIATSLIWTTAILNGADNYHIHTPPYRHSRGLFPLMLMKFKNIEKYFHSLQLDGIEPFTQIVLDNRYNKLYKLNWNGFDKKLIEIQSQEFVISSSTLYNQNEKSTHKEHFASLKNKNSANLAQLHDQLKWTFHAEHPYVKTTSRTQIMSNSKEKIMHFMNYAITDKIQ